MTDTWPPSPKNIMLARAMIPLIERGRIEMQRFILSIPEDDRPLGWLDFAKKAIVVTAQDFDENPVIIRMHVCENGQQVTILCADGSYCAMFEPRTLIPLYPGKKS